MCSDSLRFAIREDDDQWSLVDFWTGVQVDGPFSSFAEAERIAALMLSPGGSGLSEHE